MCEYLCVFPGCQERHKRTGRSDPGLSTWSNGLNTDLIHLNLFLLYQTNSWYRYAQFQAKGKNQSECYMYIRLPIAASHLLLRMKPMNRTISFCFIAYSIKGHVLETSGCRTVRYSLTKLSTTLPLAPFVSSQPEQKYPICVLREHGNVLGWLSPNKCQMVLNDRPTSSIVNSSQIFLSPTLTPQANGTYLVDGLGWLCDHAMFLTLPTNWAGLCLLVSMTDDTFLVFLQNNYTRASR